MPAPEEGGMTAVRNGKAEARQVLDSLPHPEMRRTSRYQGPNRDRPGHLILPDFSIATAVFCLRNGGFG